MNWTLAVPELVLVLCGLATLTIGVLGDKAKSHAGLATWLSIASLLFAGVLVLLSPSGIGLGGVFINDAFARFMKIVAIGGAILAMAVGFDSNRRAGLRHFEFPVLMVFSTAGMMVMASSANLMTLYIGLELQSFALYVLCAIDRDRLRSSEAGLKYFVLGSLASGLLLYGLSLVYGFSGSLDYAAIATALHAGAISPGLLVGMVFVVVGLVFKLSAVPFHMWTPDVYEGAPASVTAFLAGAPKVAAFALLIRVLLGPLGALAHQWQLLIEIVAVCSMVLGSLAAIAQTDIKRLMAYSSIGHMGYALMGIAAGNEAGTTATLVYLFTYVVMNAGAFACIVAMRRRGEAQTDIAALAGLGRRDPALAMGMAIFMFSMAGVPPLAGFFGKLLVFVAAVKSGLWVLAGVGIVTSVIGAFYYLRVVRVMYFDTPAEAFDARARSTSAVALVSGLATAGFVLIWAPVMAAAALAARSLLAGTVG